MLPVGLWARSREPIYVFAKLPDSGLSQRPCLPTPNGALFDKDATGFTAKTRTNDRYGLPGWTRGQGARFHKGVDILPVRFEKEKGTVRIEYYDPTTRREFAKNEPILVPKDEIYSILDGVVVVANNDESRSGYGRYVMIEHRFADGTLFISMYAHLDRLEVDEGDTIRRGDTIGWMGRTSSNSGSRTYLKAIPHCHFEVGRVMDADFPKTRKAQRLYPPMLGGKYDPRNIQPYHPIEFLKTYKGQLSTDIVATSPK